MSPMSVHQSRGSALTTFALVAVAYAAVTPFLPVGPAPSGDLHFVDAAYRIIDGSYEVPSGARPIHQSVRWPVVLPLSGLFATFGPGDTSLAIFSLSCLVGIALLAATIVHRITRDWVIASATALTPLLMPVDVLPIAIRGEGPAMLGVLASIVLAVHSSRGTRLYPLLSGICMAVAVIADHAAFFSAIIPMMLLLNNGAESLTLIKRLRRVVLFALGGCLLCVLMLFGEWLAFGDPLIQLKAFGRAHFPLNADRVSWSARLDPNEPERFVLGLLTWLVREQSVFVLAMLFSALSIALTTIRVRTLAGRILPGAIASLIAIDIFGGFLLPDRSLRQLSVPSFVIWMTMIAVIVGIFRRGLRGKSSLLDRRPIAAMSVGSAFTITLIIFATRNSPRMLTNAESTCFYRDPIRLVSLDIHKRELNPSEIVIVTDSLNEAGLIPQRLAVRCYSAFEFVDTDIGSLGVTSQPAFGKFVYYILADGASRPPDGAEVLDYPIERAIERPRVYFCEMDRE